MRNLLRLISLPKVRSYLIRMRISIKFSKTYHTLKKTYFTEPLENDPRGV